MIELQRDAKEATVKSMIRALAGATALAAVTVLVIVVPAGAGAASVSRCGMVAFAPSSEDGVFEITAHDTACTTARAVARGARAERFTHGDPRYRADRFSCTGRQEQLGGAGKAVVRFGCVRGRESVAFLRG
jgi:hypothetical protein